MVKKDNAILEENKPNFLISMCYNNKQGVDGWGGVGGGAPKVWKFFRI